MSSISTHLVNEDIENSKVMLVGESGLSEILTLSEGLTKAEEIGLDLVEVSQKGEVSICKLMNYSKFIYSQKKLQKANASKKEVTKEIKCNPQIADHDLGIKAKSALNNLEKGNKVKVLVVFKGREVSRIDIGLVILEKFLTFLPNSIVVTKAPFKEGRNYVMELKKGK